MEGFERDGGNICKKHIRHRTLPTPSRCRHHPTRTPFADAVARMSEKSKWYDYSLADGLKLGMPEASMQNATLTLGRQTAIWCEISLHICKL